MSYHLAVLALDASAGTAAAQAMLARCSTRNHPLSTGIDHVIMHLSFSARSDPALRAITELAEKHRLAIYDPQSSDAIMPGRQPGS